jgi:hypothetical protein
LAVELDREVEVLAPNGLLGLLKMLGEIHGRRGASRAPERRSAPAENGRGTLPAPTGSVNRTGSLPFSAADAHARPPP